MHLINGSISSLGIVTESQGLVDLIIIIMNLLRTLSFTDRYSYDSISEDSAEGEKTWSPKRKKCPPASVQLTQRWEIISSNSSFLKPGTSRCSDSSSLRNPVLHFSSSGTLK